MKKRKFPPIEIWIDDSSSMREIDFIRKEGWCYRRKLVSNLWEGCGREKLSVSAYNTSRKEITDPKSLCFNHGLNSVKRLIDWIKGSSAPYLIVITDVYELTEEFTLFLSSIQATVRGGEKSLTPSQMVSLVDGIITKCKKISP